MFAVLKHMGLGDHMLQWIARMYSKHFSISNGTRHGCPLSPLFAPALKPLLNKICQNPDILGLQVGGHNYNVSAYADDLPFSTPNPDVWLPNLLKEIKCYGSSIKLKN